MLVAGFLLALAGFAMAAPRGAVGGPSQTQVRMFSSFMPTRGYSDDADDPGRQWKVRAIGLAMLAAGVAMIVLGM